jgi:hypothetical protein
MKQKYARKSESTLPRHSNYVTFGLLASVMGFTHGAFADIIEASGESCPSGYHHLTYNEAINDRAETCAIIGTWDIARLAGGSSISGNGYNCGIIENDTRSLGDAVCKNNTDTDEKPDYFTNLLLNAKGDNGDLSGWTVLQNGGAGWKAVSNGFLTSYGWGKREQLIDLSQHDFSDATLDQEKPPIVVEESFYKTYCPDFYYLKAELLDEYKNVLTSWDSGIQKNGGTCEWGTEKENLYHIFKDYPAGVRYVRWEDGGKDAEYWGGHYGPRLDEAQLYLVSPNLLTNPNLETGNLNGWTVLQNGGNGGVVKNGHGFGGSKGLVTSYGKFKRSQTIDLIAKGYSSISLDKGPAVYLSELFREIYCADEYFLKVELLDGNQNVITAWDSGTLITHGACDYNDDSNWQALEHKFYDYGSGLRYIRWEDGGKDREYWGGNFGVVLDEAYLGLSEVREHRLDRRLFSTASSGRDGDLGEKPISTKIDKANNWCYVPFFGLFLCDTNIVTEKSCHNDLTVYSNANKEFCVPKTINILDVWGEGRIVDNGLVTGFTDAYNINKYTQHISNGPKTGADIPKFLSVTNYESPIFSVIEGSVNYVTIMGAPITTDTAKEMFRVIKKGSGTVILYGMDSDSITNFEANMGNMIQKTNWDVSSKSPFSEISISGNVNVYSFQGHDEL